MRDGGGLASLGSMRTRVASTALGFLATVAVLSLAGCTGGPGPIVTETPSATALESPSPSPSASASLAPLTDAELLALMPPDAAIPDVRGAIATAVFFVQQFPGVVEHGDLRVWDALSGPDCAFCASMREMWSPGRRGAYTRRAATLEVDRNRCRELLRRRRLHLRHASLRPGPLDTPPRRRLDRAQRRWGSGTISLSNVLRRGSWRVTGVGVEHNG